MGKPMPCIICELRETGCSAKDARITALEADAALHQQIVADKDERIAELEAREKETHTAHVANIGQVIMGLTARGKEK